MKVPIAQHSLENKVGLLAQHLTSSDVTYSKASLGFPLIAHVKDKVASCPSVHHNQGKLDTWLVSSTATVLAVSDC